MATIIESDFRPAWWLRGAHLQTIWPTIIKRKFNLPLRSERFDLPDGDFLDLEWIDQGGGPLIVVLHGLGGCIQSPYAQSMLRIILRKGWNAVFMHFRGGSGEPNRYARYYHSGETEDLNTLISYLQTFRQYSKLGIVGYSLGGNVLLKWLGEQRTLAPVDAAVAVSVPFDLGAAASKLDTGMSRIYRWWLLRSLRNDLYEKLQRIRLPVSKQELKKIKTFRELDDKVTAPLNNFVDAEDYYRQATCRPHLQNIAKPTLVLHSTDDPFMTPGVLPRADEMSEQITLEVSKHGGHVGFIGGDKFLKPQYWLDQRIPTFLEDFFR